MAKRKRKSVPVMLFWNKRDQIRFIENVERLGGLVNDLAVLVDKQKRRSQAAHKANETRKASAEVEGGVQ